MAKSKSCLRRRIKVRLFPHPLHDCKWTGLDEKKCNCDEQIFKKKNSPNHYFWSHARHGIEYIKSNNKNEMPIRSMGTHGIRTYIFHIHNLVSNLVILFLRRQCARHVEPIHRTAVVPENPMVEFPESQISSSTFCSHISFLVAASISLSNLDKHIRSVIYCSVVNLYENREGERERANVKKPRTQHQQMLYIDAQWKYIHIVYYFIPRSLSVLFIGCVTRQNKFQYL